MTEENRVKLSARSNEWWLQNPEHRAVMAKEIRRRREENPEAFAEGLRMAGEAAPRGKDHRLYGIGMDARSALYRVYHRRTCTWMRSSWEIRVADALFDWGVPFRYEPRVFDTPYGGYKPDFYLSAHDAYLEVKGFNYDPSKLEWAKGDIPRYWVVWGVKGKGRDSPNIDALRAWLGTLAPCQKPEP